MLFVFFFFKQKTAYEIVSRDWSSDVCSSDLPQRVMGSIKSGALPQQEIGSIKSGALPQREIGIIKSEGAAATRDGHFKKRGRCRNEKWAV